MRIHGLSQEYCRPKILFVIASSVGTPLCTDSATIKGCFERPFGRYVSVLVDMEISKELRYKVLVERQGFSFFFFELEYESVPDFSNYCNCIRHHFNVWKRRPVMVHNQK